MNSLNGLVRIDKPAGCTSHDIVNRWRKLSSIKRVGHLGTLDPMATGLLLLLSGTATRLAPFYSHTEKTYLASLSLGVVSDTYDAEGFLRETGSSIPDDRAFVDKSLDQFRGKFLQTPPPVSAKKIGGTPAYKLVRKDIQFELKPVQVEVHSLELRSFENNVAEILVRCSAGTYIRSIAHYLGQSLGCGAILSALRRLQISEFRVQDAMSVEVLEDLARTGELPKAVVKGGMLLPHLPSEHFGDEVIVQMRNGRDFHASPFVIPPGTPLIKALDCSGELVAIAEMTIPNLYHPKIVL
ncbi:MAG: tRNA pseudouridine(55) synthase TruB [Bryobacteraceae bacterium]